MLIKFFFNDHLSFFFVFDFGELANMKHIFFLFFVLFNIVSSLHISTEDLSEVYSGPNGESKWTKSKPQEFPPYVTVLEVKQITFL